MEAKTYPLTEVGKLFFASLYKALAQPGTKMNWKVKGNPAFIKLLVSVVEKSKAVNELSSNPEANVEELMKLVQSRNDAKREFEEQTGIVFPL